MAEGVFRDLTNFGTDAAHPLIAAIDSAGTYAGHAGSRPDPRTRAQLKTQGVHGYSHTARQVKGCDFRDFEYVIAMDEMNLADLKDLAAREVKAGRISTEEAGRVRLFGEFGGKSVKEIVGDPYYGGDDGFKEVYLQVKRMGEGLLRYIEEKNKAG